MVVLGNPPYSGHSANKGEWVTDLLHGDDGRSGKKVGNYFEVDGKPLGERNPKWLNDDYVKFIRFAQWRIEQTGYGILAFITNHGYLDNPTFRGMRQSLMQSFDDIYVLDLHGNSKKKERSPDGSKDENVFDIQQGVAIGIFVKRMQKVATAQTANFYHAHLWGSREVYEKTLQGEQLIGGKYYWLAENDLTTTEWTKITPESPFYLFVPQDSDLRAEFEYGWKVTDIFGAGDNKTDQGKAWGLGIVTHNDGLLLDIERRVVEERFSLLESAKSNDDVRNILGLEEGPYWNTSRERNKVRAYPWRNFILQYLYRPFDFRWICYQPNLMEIGRGGASKQVMYQLFNGENIALLTTRQTREPFDALCTQYLCAHKSLAAYDGTYLFPLYLYPDTRKMELFDIDEFSNAPGGRRPNLSPAFIKDISNKLNMQFIQDGKGDLQQTFGPEDIFDYMYAAFHSPTYRERYADFLKIDSPRLPLTSNANLFSKLCKLGERLVGLHLMDNFGKAVPKFPAKGNDMVEKIEYLEPRDQPELGRAYINKEQYFEGVPPEVWNFHVGGYQVCQKWLKDRKGRTLTFEDILHYQHVVAALGETIELMEQIDVVIEEHGGWPIE